MFQRSVCVWALLVLFSSNADLSAQGATRIPDNLTLQVAKSLLVNNAAFRAKQLDIEREQSDLVAANKYANPSLTFGSEGFETDSSRGPFWDRFQPSIVFRQEILLGGRKKKRVSVEAADVEISAMELQDLNRLITFDLKLAYYSVVLAQDNLKLAQNVLEQFRRVVQLNRLRFESGEISGGEFQRTEAAEYQFFSDVVDAELHLKQAQTKVMALLGVTDFARDFTAVDRFDPTFVPPPSLRLREIANRERADLAAQRARVTRSEHVIEREKSLGTPNITPFFGYQKELDTSGPVFGVDVPLFVFNRNQGPVKRARIEMRQEQARVLARQVLVFEELQIALQMLEANRHRIEGLEGTYLEKSLRARDITEASYRLGEASLMEFLDAQRTYSGTRLLYNQALYDHEISRARMELAIGEDL